MIQQGQLYRIFNQTLTGKTIIEGHARILKIYETNQTFNGESAWCLVHFLNDDPQMTVKRHIRSQDLIKEDT